MARKTFLCLGSHQQGLATMGNPVINDYIFASLRKTCNNLVKHCIGYLCIYQKIYSVIEEKLNELTAIRAQTTDPAVNLHRTISSIFSHCCSGASHVEYKGSVFSLQVLKRGQAQQKWKTIGTRAYTGFNLTTECVPDY